MIESFSLGPCPCNEVAVQVSSTQDYLSDMKQQVNQYIDMLKKRFPDCNKVEIKVERNNHDFGVYYEAAVYFSDHEEICLQQALHIEHNLPANWDDKEILYFSTEI
jgi:hypothetical protein